MIRRIIFSVIIASSLHIFGMHPDHSALTQAIKKSDPHAVLAVLKKNNLTPARVISNQSVSPVLAPSDATAIPMPSLDGLQALENINLAGGPSLDPASFLSLAQEVETYAQTKPGKAPIVIRGLVALGLLAFGIADLTVKYVYAETDQSNTSKAAAAGVFNATNDLAIVGYGGYQFYLAITDYDNTIKQKNAQLVNSLIKSHAVATEATPAKSNLPEKDYRVNG